SPRRKIALTVPIGSTRRSGRPAQAGNCEATSRRTSASSISSSSACIPAISRRPLVRGAGTVPGRAMTPRRWPGLYATSTRRRTVGAIHVHEFISLDGVIDAPTWGFDYGFDPKMAEAISRVTARCKAILLGRTTFEMFEPAWSTRTVEDDPGAPFFNETTKYVVSGTLTDPTWNNSKVVGAYDPDAIRRLKEEGDGDLYVSGRRRIRRAL